MRKPFSSGQKWFLRPRFLLIRGILVFRSGLRFSFRALEVLVRDGAMAFPPGALVLGVHLQVLLNIKGAGPPHLLVVVRPPSR